MTWMVAEAAIAITAGVITASIALVGFGLDSVIELFSAGVVIWQLRGEIAGQDRQTRAVRLIGVTFFALAAYLAAGSIRDLAAGARPGPSVPGLAVAAAALIVMPALAMAKRRTGQALGNRTLVADSAETALSSHRRRHAPRRSAEHRAGLVVGRSRRGPRHRGPRRPGRPRKLARRTGIISSHRADPGVDHWGAPRGARGFGLRAQ